MLMEKNITGIKSEQYNVSWKNDGSYTETSVNAPIIKDCKCVGVITSVDDFCVNGIIWNRQLPYSEFEKNSNDIHTEIELSHDDLINKVLGVKIYRESKIFDKELKTSMSIYLPKDLKMKSDSFDIRTGKSNTLLYREELSWLSMFAPGTVVEITAVNDKGEIKKIVYKN